MTSSFATETIVRLRYPQKVRAGGGTVTDFTQTPTETPIELCWVEPTPSTEAGGGRTATSSGYRIAMPEGTEVIAATDHVRVRGVEYECGGDAIHVGSPTGALAHAQITVTRWEG